MVLAGAGTGKTRVLVNRIAHLVRRGVDPREILAVTFTNKAAGEMRERLNDLLGIAAHRMWIGTFHATCARLLRLHGEHIGLSRNFTIFDDDDQKRLINSLLKDAGLDDQVRARTLVSQIDRMKNRGDNPADAVGGFGDDVLRLIYPQYQKRLAQEEAVDFNDILLKVLDLAAHPEVGPHLATRFHHVLVDEFQDTNLVQYQLVKCMADTHRNLTVVGDDDQSIYSWRGAEPRNLLEFDRDYPDAAIVKLEQNYRSTQTILDAANAVIACNRNRHEKALWTESAAGEPLLWEESDNERDEAEFVARAIKGLVEAEGRDYSDMAILYRTRAQSRALEEEMRHYRIDYRLVGDVSFFQRREIKDGLAYLRLVLHAGADSCFERIVNVPARGIGKTTLGRVREHARRTGMCLLDAARAGVRGDIGSLGAGARKKLARFIQLIDGLRDVSAAGASVAEFLVQVVERSGYRDWLESENTLEAQGRLENLAQLVSMASDFDEESDGEGTLAEFDVRVSLSSSVDESDGRGEGAVTLMTIHAAKGLEFPVVFLCGMEDGLFPSVREREHSDVQDAMDEEYRLAYVAMTRARERLVLTSARMRRVWGESKFNRPSRFFSHIPSECLAVRARPVSLDGGPGGHGSYSRGAPEPRPPRRRSAHSAGRARGRVRQVDHDEFDQRTYEDDVPAFDADADMAQVAPPSAAGRRRPGRRSRRQRGSEDSAGLAAGSVVVHATFGAGRVLEASGPSGSRRLLINFDDAGLKTVLERFVEPVASP